MEISLFLLEICLYFWLKLDSFMEISLFLLEIWLILFDIFNYLGLTFGYFCRTLQLFWLKFGYFELKFGYFVNEQPRVKTIHHEMVIDERCYQRYYFQELNRNRVRSYEGETCGTVVVKDKFLQTCSICGRGI